MLIKIKANESRRIAWTDRKDGYFHFLFNKNTSENGYFRGDVRYLSGFTCNGKNLQNADFIEVYPYGFNAAFEKSFLKASLLLEEQAFFISSNSKIKISDILPEVQKKEDSEKQKKGILTWKKSSIDNIEIISNNKGIAIAADFNFEYSAENNDIELSKENAEINSGFYITFEKDEKTSIEKAVRLAKENGILAHKKLIDDFLAKFSADFGDKNFNESIQWARFSAWMLATKDHGSNYRGIWAGLPWFRDNWGRDTFISLCGTLLVSGCFEEAKDVLLGFAGFQDLDKTSPSYGRIPNRYRNEKDVIYNTADGTLWFIRAVWEYVQYSGDISIIKQLEKTIDTALSSEMNHCDEHGFLMHADADTWMLSLIHI